MSLSSYMHRIETARKGTNPTVICSVPSGWVFLANMQFLRGYCILQSDPIVDSINSLAPKQRVQYLMDMVIIGDAVLEITNAYRINYAIMGNSEPILHSHIVPRFLDEPSELRKGLPWSYPQEQIDTIGINFELDKDLMKDLSNAIQKRL